MPAAASQPRWYLEIARGREPGRRYSLPPGDLTIGAGPGVILALADQEGASPRRMAPKQATLHITADGLSIRDLESPGGTFVNRRRLFTDQQQPLNVGDVIQVGAVQLIVRCEAVATRSHRTPAATAAESPKPTSKSAPKPERRPTSAAAPSPEAAISRAPLTAPLVFDDGTSCRSWDDFLTLSAQRWEKVRDALASGRIGEHLRRVGRSELLPRRDPGWSPDDVLDDWLGRLPTTLSSAAELDVHPGVLTVPAGSAGALVRRTLRIGNIGYRVLRATINVDPAAGMPNAIRLAPGSPSLGQPLAVVDETEIVVEITPPEDAFNASLGAVIVKGGGASKRVEVRIERPRVNVVPDDPEAGERLGGIDLTPLQPMGHSLSKISLITRLWMLPLGLLILRRLIGWGAWLLPSSTTDGDLRLSVAAALPALAGAILGWGFGGRGSVFDAFASTFTGAVIGVLAASLGFAVIQSFEAALGPPDVAAGVLGLALVAASYLVFPPERKEAQP